MRGKAYPPRRTWRPTRARVVGVLGATMAVLALAGCGDDEAPIEPVTPDAETSGSSPVATSEFVQSADARCAEANAAIANLTSGSEDSSLAATQQVEITQELLGGLQSLGSPEDPSGALERYYAALEDVISVLEQQGQAAVSGDSSAQGALSAELETAQEEAATAAEDFGFDECGQTESPLSPDVASTTVAPAPTPTVPAPTTTAPVAPVEPAPEPVPVPEPPPAPPSGGTGAGDPGGGGAPGGDPGDGGGSGGISPG